MENLKSYINLGIFIFASLFMIGDFQDLNAHAEELIEEEQPSYLDEPKLSLEEEDKITPKWFIQYHSKLLQLIISCMVFCVTLTLVIIDARKANLKKVIKQWSQEQKN